MLRSFYDTDDLTQPIVYGIVSMSGGDPVYIGMTTCPAKRMDNYRNITRCKNKRLADWLSENEAGFIVLYEGHEYKAKEAELIAENASDLFNLVRGGDQNWRVHRRKPWMAKTGVRCPSDAAVRIIGHDERTAQYKAWRSGLCDFDRCLHEVSLAHSLSWHVGFMRAFERWFAFAGAAVSKTLEGGRNSLLTKSHD